MKIKRLASHKDVSGFALLPSFLAGAITGFCGLGLCSVVTAKFVSKELKTPINVSFTKSLYVPEVELARDFETEKQLILDSLVVKRYQYKKFVTNNRRVPGAPLGPIKISRAAPIVARKVIIPKVVEVKVAPIVPHTPKKLVVYSALEEPNLTQQEIQSHETAADDEYSKMRSLRNTFVASLIGDMTDMTTQNEKADFTFPADQSEPAPIINEVLKEKITLPKSHPVVRAKKKKTPVKQIQVAMKVVRPRIKKAVTPAVELVKKLEVIQPQAEQSLSEKLLQVVENNLKEEVKTVGYSKTDPVSTQVAKEESKKEEIPVVISGPKVEVVEEYVERDEPLIQTIKKQKYEPAPRAQEQAPAVVLERAVEKKAEPVVVAKAWTLAPPVVTKVINVPARPLIVTIKPNDQVVPPAPQSQENQLPLNNVATFANNLRVDMPADQVEEQSAVNLEPAPAVVPEPVLPVYTPPAPERVCKTGVCFDRWLSKNNEQLDVITYSLNKIPTGSNAKEWLLTNEERSVPTLFFGANLGNIPLVNKSELEQIHKDIESAGFLLLRGNKDWSLVASQSLLEENTISSERAPGDKLFTKVQPGMLLVRFVHKDSKRQTAVAIPVLKGHVSFLDLSQPIQRAVEVIQEKSGLSGVKTDWLGTDVTKGFITTFGNYPINVDVSINGGFTHRHLVFPDNGGIKLNVEALKDKQIERFLKMLEGGVSSESGMVYGKIPLKFIGNNLRLDPGKVSRKLVPELYFFDGTLGEENQILIPTALATAKVRNLVGVQVPKGLLLISLEKPSGDRMAVQLHLSQPGVINVYQPE